MTPNFKMEVAFLFVRCSLSNFQTCNTVWTIVTMQPVTPRGPPGLSFNWKSLPLTPPPIPPIHTSGSHQFVLCTYELRGVCFKIPHVRSHGIDVSV